MQVFHYLFNGVSGVVKAERLDDHNIRVHLPARIAVRPGELLSADPAIYAAAHYDLPVDHKVRQTLVIFDGELLPDGLPRASQVVRSQPIGNICADVRKMKPNRNPLITITRHFVLLPVGNACVQGRQPPACTYKYRTVIIKSNQVGGGVTVTWINNDA